MTKRICFILVCLAALFCACSESGSVGTGGDLLGGDHIVVHSDTFSYTSALAGYDNILSSPDSFLLGELETNYGSVRGEILTQLACPVGFQYPEGARVDSVCLLLTYGSCLGDAHAPLALCAYEMDKSTLTYSKTYSTDVDVHRYCSFSESTHLLPNHRIVVASDKIDSVGTSLGSYLPMVRCKLSDDFRNRFAQVRDFSSQSRFNEQFKGLYLKTVFGGSTMLNVTDICLAVYYSFDYEKTYADGSRRDTTVHDVKGFYTNSEVRTINRFECANRDALLSELQLRDDYKYVIAPAGVYTRVSLPLAEMASRVKQSLCRVPGDTARAYVNLAELRFDIQNVNTSSSTSSLYWLQPSAYMLLIRESSMERFFLNHELPSDTCALMASISSDTENGETRYYYSYDLSALLTQQLRNASHPDPVLDMVLVPVGVQRNSSSAIVAVKQLQTLSATQIKPSDIGTNLHVIYSGF